MLNLFKLPMLSRRSKISQHLPTTDIALGILRNYMILGNKKGMRNHELAVSEISNEMNTFYQDFENISGEEKYNMIKAAFLRMENNLK